MAVWFLNDGLLGQFDNNLDALRRNCMKMTSLRVTQMFFIQNLQTKKVG
ncbi:unnamed protein product [Camellia sinensis]